MRQIILVGKLFKQNMTNGPGGVLCNLKKSFDELDVPVDYIFLNEETTKRKVISLLFKKVLLSKDKVVNIHTDGFILPMIVFFISLINKKNEYFLTVHGIYRIESEFSKTKKQKRYLLLETVLYKYFKNIICVSNKLKEDLALIYKRTKNVSIIYNGVDNRLFSFSVHTINDKDINLIHVGGINRLKGIREVLETVNYLIKHVDVDVNIKLYVYGKIENASEKAYFDSFVTEHNILNNVYYCGMIYDKEELKLSYSNSHFQLCLSLYDTFNVAVLESMAVGCPCIISNQCGAKEIINDHQNGFIIYSNSEYKEIILNIVNYYLSNRQLYKKVSLNANKTALEIDWMKIALKYKNLLK